MADLSQAVEIVVRTDPGRVRPHNEDSIAASAACGFAVVADGMGGYNAGEVASGMATSLLSEELERIYAEREATGQRSGRRLWDHDVLDREIARVNDIIYETALTQPQCAGMGTTLVLAVLHDNQMTIAHLGDSRLYRLRGDEFRQITRDHSLLQEQIDSGVLTPEQAQLSRNKNLVTRALGVDPAVVPEIRDYDVQIGDVYLLCSDGLPDMVEDEDIAMTLSSMAADLEGCAGRLVDMANEAGGRDNISVVLIRIRQAFPAARSWWQRLLAWFK